MHARRAFRSTEIEVAGIHGPSRAARLLYPPTASLPYSYAG